MGRKKTQEMPDEGTRITVRTVDGTHLVRLPLMHTAYLFFFTLYPNPKPSVNPGHEGHFSDKYFIHSSDRSDPHS